MSKNNNYLIVLSILLYIVTSCSTNKPSKKIVYKRIEKKVTGVVKINDKEEKVSKTVSTIEKAKVFKVDLPEINREFRAAWVATVANINWPSRKDLSTEQQKQEVISMLNTLESNNFNAVIFQARPSADALYKSNYEPWSYFLTGQEGRSPFPYYDPLQFWIEEAHKRGIELHVWINPYRAHHTSGGSVTSESMVKKSPSNIVRLKNGMYWFDPADKKTQNHISDIVKDLVNRYDIDGIHFDDYFYPYPSYNGGADFPDNKSWIEYKSTGGSLSRADWRRQNVNTIIERIYKEIKDIKPYVKFGISPFGIWKPGYPAGITGTSQYDKLYADAKLWLNKGWVDYFSPQLYWPINSIGQSFPKLLEWWRSENTKKRHLWPGLNTVEIKVNDKTTEILNQLKLTNKIMENNVGVIHWSIGGLTKNQSILNHLRTGLYKEKALVPNMPWIKTSPLEKPYLYVNSKLSAVTINWNNNKPSDRVAKWIVYSRYNNDWEMIIVNGLKTSYTFAKLKNGKKLTAVAIKGVDRLGNESDYTAVKVDV